LLRDILKVGAVASISPVQSILSALILTRLVSSFGTETLAGFDLDVSRKLVGGRRMATALAILRSAGGDR
jgi:hypothetical protein